MNNYKCFICYYDHLITIATEFILHRNNGTIFFSRRCSEHLYSDKELIYTNGVRITKEQYEKYLVLT